MFLIFLSYLDSPKSAPTGLALPSGPAAARGPRIWTQLMR